MNVETVEECTDSPALKKTCPTCGVQKYRLKITDGRCTRCVDWPLCSRCKIAKERVDLAYGLCYGCIRQLRKNRVRVPETCPSCCAGNSLREESTWLLACPHDIYVVCTMCGAEGWCTEESGIHLSPAMYTRALEQLMRGLGATRRSA